jgi:hypothetical protein
VGYVLVCTTLISLAMMYLIDRKIGGGRHADGHTGDALLSEQVS